MRLMVLRQCHLVLGAVPFDLQERLDIQFLSLALSLRPKAIALATFVAEEK
jgi:hypothetical protein